MSEDIDESDPAKGGRIEDDHSLADDDKKLLEDFVAFVESSNERSGSVRKSNVRAWMIWCDQTGRDINDVSKADLLNHIDDLFLGDEDTHAHTSIGARVNSISRFYTWSNGRELLSANPVEDFEFEEDYPQIDPNISQKYLTLRKENPEDDSKAILAIPEERVMKIAEAATSDRDELVIRLFWQTGIRASEMSGIKMEHIDWDDRSILIYTAKAKPKDENYTRRVYWHDNLDYLFKEWRLKRQQYLTASDDEDNDEENNEDDESGYLFNNMHSERTNPGTLSRIVKETAIEAGEGETGENEIMYRDKAGRKRWLVTAHTLRHSFGTYCANKAEIPLHIIGDRMGHKSLDTTRDYISTDEEVAKEMILNRGPGSDRI